MVFTISAKAVSVLSTPSPDLPQRKFGMEICHIAHLWAKHNSHDNENTFQDMPSYREED